MLYILTCFCLSYNTQFVVILIFIFFIRSWKNMHAFGLHFYIKQKVFFFLNGWLLGLTQVRFLIFCFYVGACKYLFLLTWQKMHKHCAFFLVNSLSAIFFVCCQFVSDMSTTIQPSANVALMFLFLLFHLLRHANGLIEKLKTKASMLFRHYLLYFFSFFRLNFVMFMVGMFSVLI